MALLHCDLIAESLGLCTSIDVILPQPAAGADRRPLKTLYLLHGMSDDHTIWQRRTAIERYVAPLDLAVIMPAVGRSYYADMHWGLRYWTYLSEELPRICHGWFPLSERREDTFCAGLSMGGYGAFKLALHQPERFAAAASLSGALDAASVAQALGHERAREWQSIFGDLSTVPGSDHDLFRQLEQVAAHGPRPRLYQWCGTEDFLLEHNRAFRSHAEQVGYRLTYKESAGGHSWDRWDDQIRKVLIWMGFKPAP